MISVVSERREAQLPAIALATIARFGAGILMGTVLVLIVEQRGSAFLASLVLAVFNIGFMVSGPTWGAIADITGRRRAVLVVTGALSGLSVLPLLVIENPWGMIGIRAIYAFFSAGFAPVMLTIASARGGPSGRGRSIGFFQSVRGAGFASGNLFAGVLLGLLVPSELYLVIAGLCFVGTLVSALVHDPTPTPEDSPTASELLGEIRRRLLPAADERGHLKTNGLGWLYLGIGFRSMGTIGVFSLLPVYLLRVVGMSEFLMGVMLAISPVGQIVFMAVFGRVADSVARKPLIIWGMAGNAVYNLVLAAATLPEAHLARLAVAGAAMVVVSIGYSAMATGAFAFIGDVAPPERESELMGLNSTAVGIGGILGPATTGALTTVVGYEIAFASMGSLSVLATVVVLRGLIEPESVVTTRPSATTD